MIPIVKNRDHLRVRVIRSNSSAPPAQPGRKSSSTRINHALTMPSVNDGDMEPFFACRVLQPSSGVAKHGQPSFSEFSSPFSRMAGRGPTASHAPPSPGRRNRGFDHPISRRDPLDARCDRTSRAVGRPTVLELKPSTAAQAPRGASPVPATRPRPRLARRAIRHKPWSRT